MVPRLRTSRQEGDFKSYVTALLQKGSDRYVMDALADLEVPPPYCTRVKVFYSSTSPADVVNVAGNGVEQIGGQSKSYLYHTIVGRKYRTEVHVPFFVASFSDDEISTRVQAVVAICKSHEWRALCRYTSGMYPELVPVLLSQSDLFRAVQRLRTLTDHSIRVRSFSARESLSSAMGKQRKSVREWTDEELDEALLVIQERRQIITSIEVDLYPKVGKYSHVWPRATCNIRKNGEIEVTGKFRLAFDAVAEHVAKVGERKLQFFSKRGLRESRYAPRPLVIKYPYPVFEKVQIVRELVERLAEYPHSMHAVTHGNPYAHVKLTDLFDWSSFHVWAIPPQQIALIPGLKASEAAVERLIHYIFDVFKEGQVAEYDRQERTLENDS